MKDASRRTKATYDLVAAEFFHNTRDRSHGAPDLDRFAAALPTGARVLDLGAGPCHDGAELLARGLRPVCMDLSAAMLRAAIDEFDLPRVQGDLLRLPFADRAAAGAWVNACLLHLDPAGLHAALAEIRRVCTPGAPVHTSVKLGHGSEWETRRYGLERFFQYWGHEGFDAVLADAGFAIVHAREDQGTRDRWVVRLSRTPG